MQRDRPAAIINPHCAHLITQVGKRSLIITPQPLSTTPLKLMSKSLFIGLLGPRPHPLMGTRQG